MDLDAIGGGASRRTGEVPAIAGGPAEPPAGTQTPLNGPCPDFSPSMAEVLESNSGTLRHIPAACRLQVAAVLGGVLSRLVQSPSWKDLYCLLALPKMVLAVGRRGGSKHPQDTANEVTRRILAFQRGEYAAL